MSKKVSVIIPTYKRSIYLERAINSVLSQSYKNVEVIVVDDNDCDSEFRKLNKEKMMKYDNYDNVMYLMHKKNKNGSAARNTGIKNATGDYITFLDDDDYFLPNRLNEMVNLLEDNPNYNCAYSSVAFLKNNEIFKVLEANKSGNFKFDLLRQNSFFGTGSNMFFRKSAINEIGYFDERFIRHQDMEYLIRYFNTGDIIGLNKILVVKCVDDRINVPNFEKMLQVKELFFDKFMNEINSFNEKKNQIYFDNYLELLYTFFYNKENRNFIIGKLKEYGKISFKIKLKCLYMKYLKNILIIKKIKKLKKVNISEGIKDEILELSKL